MDGCHGDACFLDHFTTDTREFVVGGKKHPWVTAFGQCAYERLVLRPSEIRLGQRDGPSPAVSKLRAYSGPQALVDYDL